MSIINETKASGIAPYLLFLYITNESGKLSYNERVSTSIYDQIDESAGILSADKQGRDTSLFGSALFGNALFNKQYNIDKYYDTITYKNSESASINPSINTNMWSTIGTNSAILNTNLTTNMLMEADDYTDKIIIQ